jgi:hypothetical protein
MKFLVCSARQRVLCGLNLFVCGWVVAFGMKYVQKDRGNDRDLPKEQEAVAFIQNIV